MSTADAPRRTDEPLLSVRELRTWFSTDQGVAKAVDGVSFDVFEGETLGIVGESGCGKTITCLSLIGLLPEPPARIMEGSSVRFRGEELIGASDRRMRALRGDDIAMIFQEPASSLNPVYRVGEQIAESLRVHRGSSRAEARAEALRLLGEVGIADPEARIDQYPHELSGGMNQRVMIAMAISCEPSLLIADEPTTALDLTIQAQVLELLARLRESHTMSVMLITHDLGVIAESCDRVVVMYAGQVVEAGPVVRMFEAPSHPYTRALLGSLPDPEDPRRRLVPIPGSVPTPTDWPVGCRFQERCRFATDGCEAPQELQTVSSDGHVVRCWRAPAERREEA